VTISQRTQLIGQGKGHHEIGHRQELFPLFVDPETGQVILAARAMAVTTGERAPLTLLTVRALHVEFSGSRRSATENRIKGLALVRQDSFAEPRHEDIVILVNKSGQVHSYLPAGLSCSELTKALIVALLSSSATSVR
jgi:hypothetical protein